MASKTNYATLVQAAGKLAVWSEDVDVVELE